MRGVTGEQRLVGRYRTKQQQREPEQRKCWFCRKCSTKAPNEMGPSHALAVKAALDQLSIYEIYEVVKSMKMLVDQRPDDAKKVLLREPILGSRDLASANEVEDDPRDPHRRRAYAQGANSSTRAIARKWGGAATAGPPLTRSTSNVQPPMMPTSQMMSGPPPPGYQYNLIHALRQI